MPLKLEKLAQGDRRREADLRGALKNTDPIAPSSKDTGAKPTRGTGSTSAADDAPTVATEDMGSASDEQLSEAADVLRGLALVSGRAG
jgi:carboxyl-terminal processing protease